MRIDKLVFMEYNIGDMMKSDLMTVGADFFILKIHFLP